MLIHFVLNDSLVNKKRPLWPVRGGGEGMRAHPSHPPPPPPYGHDLVLIFSWQFEDPVELTFKQ